MSAEFAEEIVTGLESSPKTMSSKYFYDEKGDALF
jgi:L-histidine Nalpha-methyltransferase